MDIQKFKKFEICKNVEEKTIQYIIDSHPIHKFQPGEYLITRKKPNRNIFLLLKGSAEVCLDDIDVHIKLIYAGESFGEISVLDKNPASANIIALSECQVILIDQDEISTLTAKSHAFTINMFHLLLERLRNFNEQVVDSKKVQRQMERKATIDALTGLYNRRWLDEHFEDILIRCQELQQPFSFIMIDIDHFKRVNDDYGHAVGDVVLNQTGAILKSQARKRDAVVRYGGEELSLLLPNTDMEEVLIIAERIRQKMEEAVFKYTEEKSLKITISLGCYTTTSEENQQQIMKQADDALYYAKENGRNQVISANTLTFVSPI